MLIISKKPFKNIIYILNKKDLDQKINIEKLNLKNFITISTKNDKDIEDLEDLIYKEINKKNINQSKNNNKLRNFLKIFSK